MFAGETAQP